MEEDWVIQLLVWELLSLASAVCENLNHILVLVRVRVQLLTLTEQLK